MLRKDIQEAIERLWPSRVVELSVDFEDSWFVKPRPKLTRALRSLKGSQLLFEREAEGDPVWWPESDPDQAPPDECAPDRSYHLYFIVPDGDAFEFTTESEDYIEDSIETVHGAGQTGWCIAVSLLAPFAVITLGERIEYDNGGTVEPALESPLETIEGSSGASPIRPPDTSTMLIPARTSLWAKVCDSPIVTPCPSPSDAPRR